MKLIPLFLVVGMLTVSGCGAGEVSQQKYDEMVQKAESGQAVWQFHLGYFWQKGLNGEKNEELAYYWYTKSAAQEYKPAKTMLSNRPWLRDFPKGTLWPTRDDLIRAGIAPKKD